jgi:putative membrane protein
MFKRTSVLVLTSVVGLVAGCDMFGGGGGGDSDRSRSSSRGAGQSGGGGSGGAQLASAKDGDPNALFMTETAHMSHAEIAASELALKKSTNPQVKQFAQQMITDHTKGNQQLMALAKQKGVNVPKRPDELHTKGAAAMANMDGTTFDKEYMSCMTSDHAKLLSSVEDKAAGATDPDVRAFAQSQLPIVRHHYQMAVQLNRALGNAATGGAGAAGGTTGTTEADATGGAAAGTPR